MCKSPALDAMLAAELAAGNRIGEDSEGWGGMTRLIILEGRFRTPAPPGLVYREIKDLHYWYAEVEDIVTREVLACR